METFTHTCIKSECNNVYQDSDPDAYYCESCQAENKAIAQKLDKQFSTRSRSVPTTPLQEYERGEKVNVKGMSFVKVSS